jgi:hypothetical protein
MELWFTADRRRFFVLPTQRELDPGPLMISTLGGTVHRVAPADLAPYEITEDQARRWAKDQLGQTLEELKQGIDDRLADLRRQLDEKNKTPVTENTTVTPDAAPALFELLKKLPGVIGNSISGEASRVESAKTAMANLQRQLKEAGIDLDDRFTRFPDRLADLRKERPQEPD